MMINDRDIESMPNINLTFGRRRDMLDGSYMLGIYWHKNLEACVGEYVYLKRLELEFRNPFVFHHYGF